MKRMKKRILGPMFSTYKGRVHGIRVDTKSVIFPRTGAIINSVCGGHVVVDESDMFRKEQDRNNG